MPLFGDEPEERPARARVPRSRPSCLFGHEHEERPQQPSSSSCHPVQGSASATDARLFGEEPAERAGSSSEERAASSGDSGSSPEDGHMMPPSLNLDWSVLHKFREFNFMSKAKEALQAPPPKRAYDNSGRMKKAQEGLQKRPSGMLRDRALDKTRLRKLLSQRCLCS